MSDTTRFPTSLEDDNSISDTTTDTKASKKAAKQAAKHAAKQDKADKTAKSKSAAKHKGLAPTSEGWVAPASAFDYLGNAWKLFRRRRLFLLSVTGLIVVGTFGLSLQGLSSLLERNSADSAVEAAQSRQQRVRLEFSQVTGPGGVPVDTMLRQLDTYRRQAVGIAGGTPDTAVLLIELERITVPGVDITGFAVKPNAERAPAGKDGKDGNKNAETSAPATAPELLGTAEVTITGTVTDQQSLNTFVTAVERISVLREVRGTFQSGNPGTLTITAVLGPSTDWQADLEVKLSPGAILNDTGATS